MKRVSVTIAVEYNGTTLVKTVALEGTETNAVMVNQALERATKKIQIMVQSEQNT